MLVNKYDLVRKLKRKILYKLQPEPDDVVSVSDVLEFLDDYSLKGELKYRFFIEECKHTVKEELNGATFCINCGIEDDD